jgi:uncharacterized protein
MIGGVKVKYLINEELGEKRKVLPEGYLLCMDVPIARTGNLTYLESEIPSCQSKDGKVIVERDEESLFNELTISSFNGKPFVVTHPPRWDNDSMITTKNWKDYAAGVIQCTRRGEGDQQDLLVADILVQDEDAIKYINNGMREISIGYNADFLPVELGLAKQSNLRGNHVALVVKGRAGERCAIGDSIGEVNNLSNKSSMMDAVIKVIRGLGLDADPEFKDKVSCNKDTNDSEVDPNAPDEQHKENPIESNLEQSGIQQVLSQIQVLSNRVSKLESFAEKLAPVEEKEHGQEFIDEKGKESDVKKESGTENKKSEVIKENAKKEDSEEAKDKNPEEYKKCQDEDSIASFVEKVGILITDPIDLPDPATDSIPDIDKAIFEGKKKVLSKVNELSTYQPIIKAIVGDAAIDSLDPKTINTVFRTACIARHTTGKDAQFLSKIIFADSNPSEKEKKSRKMSTGEELGSLYNKFWNGGDH